MVSAGTRCCKIHWNCFNKTGLKYLFLHNGVSMTWTTLLETRRTLTFQQTFRKLEKNHLHGICTNVKYIVPILIKEQHAVTYSGWPDQTNFRILGEIFFWVVFLKITHSGTYIAYFLGLLFPAAKVVHVLVFGKIGLGYILDHFFHK
jgi:hypothetical protein